MCCPQTALSLGPLDCWIVDLPVGGESREREREREGGLYLLLHISEELCVFRAAAHDKNLAYAYQPLLHPLIIILDPHRRLLHPVHLQLAGFVCCNSVFLQITHLLAPCVLTSFLDL